MPFPYPPVRTLALLVLLVLPRTLPADEPTKSDSGEPTRPVVPGKEPPVKAPTRVEVKPEARDDQIRERLESILRSTEWFQAPRVKVQEGVVFLEGHTTQEEYRKWAGDLARNTQDVAAVVNRIEVTQPSPWDFSLALAGLGDLWRDTLTALPMILFALLILFLFSILAVLATRASYFLLRNRITVSLLRDVISRCVGLLVFLLGLYVVLKISGLTRLALTVLGGTGLLGLIIGIAFRDITENFLASILLSVQRPFQVGDLVDVNGIMGFVQQLNVRTTMLMTLAGEQVQIPNSTIYKSVIRNYTSNPNRREDFALGIGYEADITQAQEITLRVLMEHPAVLLEPEPSVLVESLDNTILLRSYFWLDGSKHSPGRVKSSVLRLVKRAFQQHAIPIPDTAREVIFPSAVPVQLVEARQQNRNTDHAASPVRPQESRSISTQAEGGLHTEAHQIEEQAKQARGLNEDDNLLTESSNRSPTG